MKSKQVELAWGRIEPWLAQHEPAYHTRLNPSAAPALLHRAAHDTGCGLPAALVTWWSTVDGVGPDPAAGPFRLFPHSCDPYPLGDALARRATHLAALRSTVPAELRDTLEQWLLRCAGDPAGTCYPGDTPAIWLPQWLPVAGDGQGGGLFADLRSGPLTGCLIRFTSTSHAARPDWQGMESLLDQVARRL